jgi:DNA polymerase III subunit gamma/tau
MGQALYRKYRPRSLKDVAGQEHITHTLEQALKSGRISHAYLFTGPRGVGKTSIARILAHEINGLEYSEDSSHIDIIEIDAASNRRIDEIRELRERVYISPASAKYKVYIIDEVHMLTREAFNALLKTLEEPPEHAVFILATTEVHKLPETIISRTQRYAFKPISREDMFKKLKDVAGKEKVEVTDEALKLLSEHAQGSLRDGESLLDQAISRGDKVTDESIIELLGLPPAPVLKSLLDTSLTSSEASKVVSTLTGLNEQGYQADTIAAQLFASLRELLISKNNIDEEQALSLMSDLIEVPASSDPERFLEIALIKAQPKRTARKEPAAEKAEQIKDPEPEIVEEQEHYQEPEQIKEAEPAIAQPESKLPTKPAAVDDELWNKVLAALKQKHSTLYGIARMAAPDFSEKGKLELTFGFELHKKRVGEAANKQLLMDTIKDLTGKEFSIECLYKKGVSTPKPKVQAVKAPEPDSGLSAISNIFNGAELLES